MAGSPGWGKKYSSCQILTVADLLAGKGITYPPSKHVTFKKAPKAKAEEPEQLLLAAESKKPYKPKSN